MLTQMAQPYILMTYWHNKYPNGTIPTQVSITVYPNGATTTLLKKIKWYTLTYLEYIFIPKPDTLNLRQNYVPLFYFQFETELRTLILLSI